MSPGGIRQGFGTAMTLVLLGTDHSKKHVLGTSDVRVQC